jgi:hypothetical protein
MRDGFSMTGDDGSGESGFCFVSLILLVFVVLFGLWCGEPPNESKLSHGAKTDGSQNDGGVQ